VEQHIQLQYQIIQLNQPILLAQQNLLVDQEVVVQKVEEEDQQDQLQMESMELVEMVHREALLEAVQREGVVAEVPIQEAME
jgi:hypothetical protein